MPFKTLFNLFIFFSSIMLIFNACTNTPSTTVVTIENTSTPMPTATQAPTQVPTQTVEPTNEPPTPTDVIPTETPLPVVADTPTPEPSPTPETDWLTVTGRTVENLAYRGNPNAPIRLVDYSDFM